MAVDSIVRDGIAKAIQGEIDGYHFYMMAARSTTDPQGREVFESLAREELEHQRFLQAQLDAITKTGRPDPGAQLGEPPAAMEVKPIFSPAIRDRLKAAHFELSALSLGMQLELASLEEYRRLSEAASEPAVRKLFADLAAWEQSHYRMLVGQYDELKDEYWNLGGFSPT